MPSLSAFSSLFCFSLQIGNKTKAMAWNLISAKAVVSSLADKVSAVNVSRRGFAAAVSGGGGSGAGRSTAGMMRRIEQTAGKTRESAWAPDPVTGNYRPSDRAVEIDAAELRAMLLNTRAKN